MINQKRIVLVGNWQYQIKSNAFPQYRRDLYLYLTLDWGSGAEKKKQKSPFLPYTSEITKIELKITGNQLQICYDPIRGVIKLHYVSFHFVFSRFLKFANFF